MDQIWHACSLKKLFSLALTIADVQHLVKHQLGGMTSSWLACRGEAFSWRILSMLSVGQRYIGQAGCYAVARLLGYGSFGCSYEAWDVMGEQRVVIKEAFLDTVEVLEYEARILSRLRLFTAPRAIEFLTISPAPLLMMQFRRGLPLDKWLHTFPGSHVPLPLVIQVGLHLAQALADLHAQGLAHGDLHAGNVLWDPEVGISLLDFGCARGLEGTGHLPRGFNRLGAEAYAAPERLQTRRATPQTDLYSLGVLLYELCTGTLPDGELQPLPRCLWNSIGVLIRLLLDPDPFRRPTAAGTVAHLQWLIRHTALASSSQEVR
jgi:serine/threonine protein kinase